MSDTYTMKDMMKEVREEVKLIHEKLDKVHLQTKLTNGRVTILEDKSVGMWIKDNPLKFVIYVLIFLCLVISDIRHPIISLLTSFI